jgi:hypothetical protein
MTLQPWVRPQRAKAFSFETGAFALVPKAGADRVNLLGDLSAELPDRRGLS